MKRKVQLTGILLMLLLSFNMSLNAQKGMKHPADSTRLSHMRMASDTAHRNSMSDRTWLGPERMDHMRNSRNRHSMYGMDRGMRQDYGMRRGYGHIRQDSMSGRQVGPAGMILWSIPDITEAQKKQITDLMTKQRSEMQKLREETQTKMEALRDSHRKSVLNVLTDEQKKFVETREKGSEF
jgi:Spy/CpxP family protein refolding chaperone